MSKKLYVGNLNYRTTEDQLTDLFGQFGTVVSSNIIVDRETQRSKGFAFVELEDDDSASAAISQLDGSEFLERNIRVNEAVSKPRTNNPRNNNRGGYRR